MNWPARSAFAMLKCYARFAPTERGGYRLARLARRLLPREKWQGDFASIDGFSLSLDLATYPDCCLAVGLYELDTYRQIRRILRPGMWFVDCGANLGYFSMLAARLVGPRGRVDAYEPDPANRQRLLQHLQANGLAGQVRVHPLAVGAAAGEIELYHPRADGTNHGMTSAYAVLAPDALASTVATVRLDDHLEGVPDLIKLDVEGGELPAIEGMAGILQSDRPPAIIVELNRETAAAAGYSPVEMLRRLLQIQPDYDVYFIDWRLRRLERPEDVAGITRLGNLLIDPARCTRCAAPAHM